MLPPIEKGADMGIRMRGIAPGAAPVVMIAFALIAGQAGAQTPGKSIKDQLVGHWDLVSVTLSGATPYGANPKGSMFIDADGHYSVIVLTAGRANNISYFGSYTVDEAASSMTLHIDGSSRASADGRDQKRLLTFSGDELIQDTPPSAGPRGSVKVTWKRST
jgi:hypothetical protein